MSHNFEKKSRLLNKILYPQPIMDVSTTTIIYDHFWSYMSPLIHQTS